jgi:hypothetical protein
LAKWTFCKEKEYVLGRIGNWKEKDAFEER